MNFNHDLLAALLSALENAGISCGAGVALRVQQIFMLQGIQSWDDLARARHLIGPVVARSKEEQARFQQVFRTLVQQHVKTVAPAPPDLEQKREAINKKAWGIAIGSCIAVFVIAIGIYYVISRETEKPYHVQLEGPQQAYTGQSVSFLAVTDKLHTWSQLAWDFGDGNLATYTGDNVQANHIFKTAGLFPVIVTAWSDSVQVKDTLQVKVLYDSACTVVPGFTVSNDKKPNINAEIRFTNTSTGKCITRYEWDFNDNTRTEKKSVTDTLPFVHRFTERGTYDVTLKAFTADTVFEFTRPVAISDNDEIIPLAEFQPLQKSNETVTKLRHHRYGLTILLLALVLLLPLLFVLMRFYYRKKQLNKLFDRHYHPQQAATAPYTFKTETGDAGIRSDKTLSELAFRLRQSEKNDQLQFDIYDTIAHTIQHAGFPKIIFDEENLQPEYLVIADAGSGRNQQAELFKQLLETLGMYRVHMVVFYYSGSMETLFSNTHPEGIPLSRVAVQYSRTRLLVYSDGYSLLNEHTSDGFVTWAAKVFSTWKHRALLTPVPRYSWDEDERKLLQLFRIYPAGLYGHLLMAGDFMRNRYQLMPRKNVLPALHPFTGSLRHYKKYFSRPGDALLYRWLLALSVPEEVNWENTLLAGKAVEARYCGPNEQLVTFDNLLRLTAIDWLQQGQLSPKHRAELYHELQQEPDAEALQRDINRELLVQTEKADPPENSAAALSKKIQLALLRYQLRDKNAGTHEEQELHYLQQQGLLGRFANTEVVKETRGYTRFKPRRDFWVRMLGFSIMIAGFFFLFRNPLLTFTEKITGTKPKTEIITDSLAYFNNRAAQQTSADPDESNVIYAARFLDSAKKYDTGKDDTLTYNILLNTYRKGLFLYKKYDLRTAAKVLRDSTLTGYSGSAADTRTLAQNLLHAEGVCCYYLSSDTMLFIRDIVPTGKIYASFKASPYYQAFRAYGERAVTLNRQLQGSNFYSTYPNTAENLEVLLNNSNANIQNEMYLLTVLPADEKTRPLLSISNAQGKELKSGYKTISMSMPGGTYRVKAKYAESTFDTLIRLNSNMKVLTRRESSEPRYYAILGAYNPGAGDPALLRINVYDAGTKQKVNTIATTGIPNGEFTIPLPFSGTYRLEVISTGNTDKVKPTQSFEMSVTQLFNFKTNLVLSFNGQKLRASQRTENPPGSGQFIRKELVVKQTDTIADTEPMLNIKLRVFGNKYRDGGGVTYKLAGITIKNTVTGKVFGITDLSGELVFGVPRKILNQQLNLTLELNGDINYRTISVNETGQAKIELDIDKELPQWKNSTGDQSPPARLRRISEKTLIRLPVNSDFQPDDMYDAGLLQNAMLKVLQKYYPKQTFFLEDLDYAGDMINDSLNIEFMLEQPRYTIQLVILEELEGKIKFEVRVNNPSIFEPIGKGIPVAVFQCTLATFEQHFRAAVSPAHRTDWQEQLKLQPWYKPK